VRKISIYQIGEFACLCLDGLMEYLLLVVPCKTNWVGCSKALNIELNGSAQYLSADWDQLQQDIVQHVKNTSASALYKKSSIFSGRYLNITFIFKYRPHYCTCHGFEPRSAQLVCMEQTCEYSIRLDTSVFIKHFNCLNKQLNKLKHQVIDCFYLHVHRGFI
jgi:hypothetical protein